MHHMFSWPEASPCTEGRVNFVTAIQVFLTQCVIKIEPPVCITLYGVKSKRRWINSICASENLAKLGNFARANTHYSSCGIQFLSH